MKYNLKKILTSRIALHVYFWIFIFVFFSYRVIFGSKIELLLYNLIYLPWDIVFTYFVIYILLKIATEEKQYFLFFFLLLISLTGYIIFAYFIEKNAVPAFFPESNEVIFDENYFFTSTSIIVLIILLASTIKLLRENFKDTLAKNELEKQNLEAKNNMLRSQINPHFLFNTLNNISALIEIDRERSRASVERLSNLMSYMVYEGNSGFIAIKDELKFIENYIKLQELRLNKEYFTRITIEGDPGKKEIANMLLIPLVENAFKYCERSADNGISIHVLIDDTEFCFSVENKFDKEIKKNNKKSGFGLNNLKERLKLIYPERHNLKIEEINNIFIAKLCIQIANR